MRRQVTQWGAAALLALAVPTAAIAQDEWPMEPAEYVEVSAIHIDDGYGLKYANHLANVWRKAQDYAVQQGWITGYEVLVNTHPRKDEPNIYLLTRFNTMVSPEEGDRRGRMMREHLGRTLTTLEQESAGRAEYRKLGNQTLLRRMKWKK